MTVIAWDGKVLAADRMICQGDTQSEMTKISRHGERVVAIMNTMAVAIGMREWYLAGADVEKFKVIEKGNDGGGLIVWDGEQLWEYVLYPHPLPVEGPFRAWGVGREAALGALAMGAGAAKAVQIASKYVAGCGFGVDFFDTGPETGKTSGANSLDNFATWADTNGRIDIGKSEAHVGLKVPLGAWGLRDGLWHPNTLLDLTPGQQHAANLKNGFSCKHGYMPAMCSECRNKEG